MGKVYLDEDILQDTADAIRAKSGESGTMTPAEMPNEINALDVGEDIEAEMRKSDLMQKVFLEYNMIISDRNYIQKEIDKVENIITYYKTIYEEGE